MDTIILTDSSCDLPLEIIEKNQISFLGLNYHLSYGDYVDDFGKSLDYKKFYNSVREGEMPTIGFKIPLESMQSKVNQLYI